MQITLYVLGSSVCYNNNMRKDLCVTSTNTNICRSDDNDSERIGVLYVPWAIAIFLCYLQIHKYASSGFRYLFYSMQCSLDKN